MWAVGLEVWGIWSEKDTGLGCFISHQAPETCFCSAKIIVPSIPPSAYWWECKSVDREVVVAAASGIYCWELQKHHCVAHTFQVNPHHSHHRFEVAVGVLGSLSIGCLVSCRGLDSLGWWLHSCIWRTKWLVFCMHLYFSHRSHVCVCVRAARVSGRKFV